MYSIIVASNLGIKCLVVISNSITSENLITVKEFINNWQIASISKKYIYILKNTGQLDPTRNPTQLATRLTRNPIDPFKNDPFWPVTRFDPRPDWPNPNPTVLPCLGVCLGSHCNKAPKSYRVKLRTFYLVPFSSST